MMSSTADLGPLHVVDYSPGVCNIGPAEIARRRMAGHLGLLASVVVLVSASGYLQAWFHFCAGFGSRGVYNFGPVGTVQEVVDPAARARDRARSMQIGVGSIAIGAAVAIVAALLPI